MYLKNKGHLAFKLETYSKGKLAYPEVKWAHTPLVIRKKKGIKIKEKKGQSKSILIKYKDLHEKLTIANVCELLRLKKGGIRKTKLISIKSTYDNS